jgi:hypothetical protein
MVNHYSRTLLKAFCEIGEAEKVIPRREFFEKSVPEISSQKPHNFFQVRLSHTSLLQYIGSQSECGTVELYMSGKPQKLVLVGQSSPVQVARKDSRLSGCGIA